MPCRRRAFLLPEGTTAGEANALRRALVMDLRTTAPSRVRIRTNTSPWTDEFLAQRIGLIPFASQTGGENCVATLRVSGRDALASDLVVASKDGGGDLAMSPQDGRIVIARMLRDQTLDLDVHFETSTGREHARFTRTVAVGMQERDGGMVVAFECFGDDHASCAREAIASLRARLEAARERIAH